MDPLPYNVTISSQTASIVYSPARDGNTTAGWNVTYSDGTTPAYGSQQGIGTDYHQTTLDGSTMQLSWVGTAIYLYGQANNASFSIDVDGVTSTYSDVTIPQGGLLGVQTELAYSNHTAALTTHGSGLVAFQYAELTIGIGYPGWASYCVHSPTLPF